MERSTRDADQSATGNSATGTATTGDVGKSPGLRIDRKAGGSDSIEGVSAQATVDTAKGASGGSALDAGTQGKMEGAFGADFGDVRVHAGGAAGQAASDLNARAFTTGKDIFFGEGEYNPDSEEGEHLLAHELTHVVQQGSGAKGTGDGTTISESGDSAEHEADHAADAVVRGDRVGAVGGGPTSMIHRDALGDLNSTSKGSWIGNVDEGQALSRLAALSPAEKARLVSDSSLHPMLERLCKAFSAGEMMRMFGAVPQMDLRWRVYWLSRAGVSDELSQPQWIQVIGFASPAEMDSLRAYPEGFRVFLQNAPARLIAPWDRIQGLELGHWKGSATEIRNAIEGLNPTQKATVIGSDAKMRLIMRGAGEAADKFRTITYLNPACKWKVYWLSIGGALDHLTRDQWAEMLAQAPQTEYDELVAYPAGWALVEKHCPAAVIQITRQNAKADNAVSAMADPVQVNALFASLGPAGFLAESVKGTAVEVPVNYAGVKAAGKVLPTVTGLERGAKMGAGSKANLRQWFALETDAAVLEQMCAARFNVNMTGSGSKAHEKGDDPATLAPWTVDTIRHCWEVCERLPPEQVEQNPRFRHLLRNSASGNGNAYFWGDDVVMGTKAGDNIGATTSASNQVYQAGGQGAGSSAVAVNKFNATLRHEIGHAVDAQLGIMDAMQGQLNCGGWIKYSSYDAFVDAIIAAEGGMSGHGYPDESQYKKAMKKAVKEKKDFLTALGEISMGALPAAAAFENKGPVRVVWTKGLWSGSPWYQDSWKTTATSRNFQRAYDDASSLYSFNADIKASNRVTKYQWRAPAEWFAECYQVYYAEQETGPDVPVGGILRSKDAPAAALIATIADRGYSPQDMRGGTTAKAPGT
ncbi:MAG: DUF4157 domain-containing protein [Deltaproteobacteria bacterium]|nr:DUF4157 domain-containing protein [Deltaproteobacteria bacterium]